MEFLGNLPVGVDVAIWFGTSVICTSGSKHILNTGIIQESRWLTLIQLSLSALIGKILLVSREKVEETVPVESTTKLTDLTNVSQLYWLLSLTFVVGFGTLNASFSYLPVSLAMTLRAAEPIFSVVLVKLFNSEQQEAVSLRLCLTLIPIVVGTSMSSLGSLDFSAAGFMLVCLANIAFPLRMIIFKKLKEVSNEFNQDSFRIFYGVCWRASSILLVGNSLIDTLTMLSDNPTRPKTQGQSALSSLQQVVLNPRYAFILVLNGACYFAYLQWSFVVQSKVALVTHAVCNAMRRPVNIVVAVWFFGTTVTLQNGVGILLASGGALLYSKVKASDSKIKSSERGDIIQEYR